MSESDEPEISSHGFHSLLANLNRSSQPVHVFNAQLPSFVPSSSRSSPPSLAADTPATVSTSGHPTPQTEPTLSPDFDPATSPNSNPHQLSLFNTPSRSIFSSGPPTSSVSVNTAHASMSAPSPVNPSQPLSALTVPSTNSSRRSVHYQSDGSSSIRTPRASRAEKDVDDPSLYRERARSVERRSNSTPTALTRLFTAPETATPTVSRQASYIRTPSGTPYIRASSSDTAPLPSHLYSRGLLSGKHSDITVHVFGTRYALHRLLLDRAPFFSSALSEPWFESSSRDIELHPEDIDSNITQSAFDLALKRLYGCESKIEEDKEAVGLFATGCWLEMADLIDSSVTSILRQMTPGKVAPLIRLVTNNYYGKPGDRILESSKAMLCREGWEMPLKYWDGISGEIAREIIGGDGFFVPGEWERWVLAKRVLDRKLKLKAIEAGVFDANGKYKRAPPDTMNFLAIRFDTVYRKESGGAGRPLPEAYDSWVALYTNPDIAALLVLLDEGIHYIHLSFEQLQKIRDQRDVLGLPVMPERVITNALWMSMELRQKVVNAREHDMELGLTQASDDFEENLADEGNLIKSSGNEIGSTFSKGKEAESSSSRLDGEEEMESGSWDGNGKPRKFWIPHTDSTSVTGGNPDSLINAVNGTRPYMTRHLSRFSASIDPVDVQWASDFTAATSERPHTPGRSTTNEPVPPISYTHYPPFRFSAEFPNPRNLREKKRVYSRTVWYAGSLWNVYIQKVETSKNTQLGIYLHRAKEKDGTEDMRHGSVDERIGQMELLMRRNVRNRHQNHHGASRGDADDSSGSGGDPDATLVSPVHAESSRASAISSLLQGSSIMKASQTPRTLILSNLPDRSYNASTIGSDDDNDELDKATRKFSRQLTMPTYVDDRPTIKTYFKIYSPSKGGRMLSVYESAPDHFNFSQSWGWKSSTMILDDGLLGYEDAGARSKDSKLRFMVVIGNV
ncbi:MAG: hypothetical protein LQ342_001585 [Letrouitia transgressa]|nr:MAG: hypothetical protein LQ342_001585 [Letrouitia transgressa]